MKFKYFSDKLLLSQKLRYFSGSRFSQCSTLSTALSLEIQQLFHWKSVVEEKQWRRVA